MGPHKNVTKIYFYWKELFDEIGKDMYGENIMFRKKRLIVMNG